MITDRDLIFDKNKGWGIPLVWIIDGDCLYDLPLNYDYADIFMAVISTEDISSEYPDHDGITLKLNLKDEKTEIFQTSEYFGSILLSDPLVLNLLDYPYGRYVQSPYAKFDGEKFLIFSQDVTNLSPWFKGMEK